MKPGHRTVPRSVLAFAVVVLGAVTVAGCSTSTGGAKVSCTLSSCTATFDRGVDATASVLGIDLKVVAADTDKVTVEVAGNRLVVPVGGSQEAAGLSVAVEKVTEQQVVLKVAKA